MKDTTFYLHKGTTKLLYPSKVTRKMSAELVANDGSSVVLSLSPDSKEIQAVRIMLGPTTVELKAMHGPDGSTSLDVLLGQHQNPKPTALASTSSTTLLSHEAKVAAAAGEMTDGDEWVKEMRGWLMVLASVFANMTFQAGLNPPGGFWQESCGTSPLSSLSQAPVPTPSATGYAVSGVQHKAGDPVLHDTHRGRYGFFFWSNTIAFAYSLSMVMLLLSKRIFNLGNRMPILRNAMIVNSFAVAIAFVAGSARGTAQTSLVLVLMGSMCLASLISSIACLRVREKAQRQHHPT